MVVGWTWVHDYAVVNRKLSYVFPFITVCILRYPSKPPIPFRFFCNAHKFPPTIGLRCTPSKGAGANGFA